MKDTAKRRKESASRVSRIMEEENRVRTSTVATESREMSLEEKKKEAKEVLYLTRYE
jgi:hypothetical protein